MATNRQYEACQVFNVRVVDLRHLWEPSREYKGQQTQKPNYFATFITPKTQPHWSTEPVFGGVMQAFQKLLAGQFQAFAHQPAAAGWPIVDGDMPNPETGKHSEFAKGHWLFTGSTGNPPNVELVQAGGALVKLQNRINVKPGDFTMAGLVAAVKKNDARGVKFYLNAVVFTGPGDEIVFANSVSGAEMMRAAEAQGFRPQGFAPGGGFGGGASGFAPRGGQQNSGGQWGNPGGSQGQGGGFGGGAPNGGFTHGNPAFGQPGAPTTGNPAPQGFGAPAPGGTPNGFGGSATSLSNPPNAFGQPGPQFNQNPGQWPGQR